MSKLSKKKESKKEPEVEYSIDDVLSAILHNQQIIYDELRKITGEDDETTSEKSD